MTTKSQVLKYYGVRTEKSVDIFSTPILQMETTLVSCCRFLHHISSCSLQFGRYVWKNKVQWKCQLKKKNLLQSLRLPCINGSLFSESEN